jgi:DNA-binding MarR family transcriptional regulator
VKTIDGLIKSLLVLARTVNHVLETRAVESAVGEQLSPSKVQILRLLGERGRQNSSRVAYFLGVSKPAVSQIIDAMSRDGLVSRETALHDRREVQLQLTSEGKLWYRTMRRQQRHLIRNAIRQHAGSKAGSLIKTLQDTAVAVAQADQAFKDYCLQCGAHADETCVLVGGDADCRFLGQNRARRGPRPRRATTRLAAKRSTRRRRTTRA